MAAKKILAGVLLLFVLASVATLVWKERARSRAIRAAAPAAAANRVEPAPPGTLAAASLEKMGSGLESAPNTASTTRPDPEQKTQAAAPSKGRKIVVTYFLTTTRCFSCYKIETLTESAVQTAFVGPLREGRLVWRTLNTDEPANAHYLKDYKLFTKSVIVSEVVDGREVRWKNCEKVWDLLDDPKAFEAYIVKEVKAYLGDA